MIEKVMYFFVIGSLLGWILEALFKAVVIRNNVTPGILKGPFCILYGIGLVFLAIVLSTYTSNILMLFILSAVFLSIFEYITAVLLKKIYNIKLWDYSEMMFKINEKVCLEFSLIWGLLGTIFIKYILPQLNILYTMLEGQMLTIVLMAVCSYIIIDLAYTSELLNIKKNESELV